MIDHLMLKVRDYDASRKFYDAVLAPLGYRMLMEFGRQCGYGDEKPYFWIGEDPKPHPRMHLAFAARDRPRVDAFHEAALKAGATDNGSPGVRDQYHANYYGAFVIDPDGHNVEAVCHKPPARAPKPKATASKKASPKRAART